MSILNQIKATVKPEKVTKQLQYTVTDISKVPAEFHQVDIFKLDEYIQRNNCQIQVDGIEYTEVKENDIYFDMDKEDVIL